MPLISFCVPTYNRSAKSFELVSEILSFQSSDIEVIVLDNASTDNTKELLKKIVDPRFKYFKNDISILGPQNIIKSLTLGSGKFSFLCLDKDFVKTPNLIKLINILEKNSDLAFGYCKLNTNEDAGFKLFNAGFDSLYHMAYLSAHPTGMFYKSDYLKKLSILNQIFQNNTIFGFYPDILNAELATLGKSIIIESPIFFTETKEDCANTLSFTFKSNSDLFFSPKKRYETLVHYVTHILQIHNLTKISKYKLIKKVFLNELNNATLGFKSILKDKEVCLHYYIKTRELSNFELLKIYLHFNIKFLFEKNEINPFIKIKIIIESILINTVTIIKNKQKNLFEI
jgi:glycosyltransferase involved in cell wall biosynthesis